MKKNSTLFFVLLLLLSLTKLTNTFGQGNGIDGPLNVISGTTIINTTVTEVQGSNEAGTIINVVSTGGFSVGDAVLVIQMEGSNAGSYNELTIASLTATTLTFTTSTSVTYSSIASSKAQVIRIHQFTTVTVNSGTVLTAPAWNGTTGGVLIYYANGAVTINGTQTMTGAGFTGGTGGTGSAAGTSGTPGSRGNTSGADGTSATPTVGGVGGSSFAGKGGNGGVGNVGAINPGTTGNGPGAGTSGIAGTNMSSGLTTLMMGGGGGGGQGGQGGQYGGAGGGGGASSIVLLGSGRGADGTNGTGGTASTAVGGNGGIGGGIIFMKVYSITGNGIVSSNGTNGSSGTGVGGNGGNGGNGGDGGAFVSGLVLTNGGGGGGAGKGGQGGQGSGGGGGGGAGAIVILTAVGTPGWTGSMINSPGLGGNGGAGGTSGTSGTGGTGGNGWLLGDPGSSGAVGGPVAPGLAGPTGAPNPAANMPFILPLEVVTFSGSMIGSEVILHWSTAKNVTGITFVIERSSDGINFAEIGSVAGTNQLAYSFTDRNPGSGTNYYRIKQIDNDGGIAYSSIIALSARSTEELGVYPNPVGDDKKIYIKHQFTSVPDEPLQIVIYNPAGIVVMTTSLDIRMSEYMVSLPSDLGAGVYYMNAQLPSAQLKWNKKIVVK